MMRKLCILFFAAWAAVLFAAKDEAWEIRNMPAMYDNPGIIKLIPGEVQPLTFYFMVPESVLQTGGRVAAANAATGGSAMTIKAFKAQHSLRVDMDMPQGLEFIISNAGGEKHYYKRSGSKVIDTYSCHYSRLQPKRRMSEWKNYRVVVKTPAKIPAGKHKFTMVLSDEGKVVASKTWEIQYVEPLAAAPKLKYFNLGLWDYGLHHMSIGQQGVVDMYKKAGFNCFFKELKHIKHDPDFRLFGSYSQDYLIADAKKYPNYGPDGRIRRIALNGWYLKNGRLDKILPDAVKGFLDYAKLLNSGMVGMDYEPTSVEEGFIPASIEYFKKRYHVSDAEFEKMRQGLAENYFKYRAKASDAEKKVFDKWNKYQSELSADFIRELVNGIKAGKPGLKFHNTTLDALPPPDPKGAGLGIDPSLQAKYLDVIEPQLYIYGYPTSGKYAIQRTAEWKKRIEQLNPKCELHPLFIVRHSGTKTRNPSPVMGMNVIGACAEGASGASFYFAQCFNAYDYLEMSKTVKLLAAVEDFYAKGKRCDKDFKVTGAVMGYGWHPIFPSGSNKVHNYKWHMTAHKLNGKVLVTFFNFDTKPMTVKLKSRYSFEKVSEGKRTSQGITVQPQSVAFIWYK